jgi:hypothetical protein
MRKTNGAKKTPAFVARAERAFARVARKVRLESRRSGLPAVVFLSKSHKLEKERNECR